MPSLELGGEESLVCNDDQERWSLCVEQCLVCSVGCRVMKGLGRRVLNSGRSLGMLASVGQQASCACLAV